MLILVIPLEQLALHLIAPMLEMQKIALVVRLMNLKRQPE
jgi:hypothetical protein